MNIEQYTDVYNRQTVVRIGRITVRVCDITAIKARKQPVALALDAFYGWIGQYADHIQQRFERVV